MDGKSQECIQQEASQQQLYGLENLHKNGVNTVIINQLRNLL
jgi:hypothetical protein